MSRSAQGEHSTLTYWPALDGVRALAVTVVLLFHGGVSWLPGGFLGVDAFFVLSGFLITSLLLAERERTGRIHLGRFWLRRARRLLPALLVMLVVVVVAFRDRLPRVEVGLLRGDALAALGYIANWRMIYRGDDYFTQTAAPSPLQHTWSLGIEEQFYVAWPLVIVALLALSGPRMARRWLVVFSLVAAAASAVVAAVLFDPLDVNRAYFGTDSRAQALLIGCALAAGLPSLRRRLDPDAVVPARPGLLSRLLGRKALSLGALVATIGVGWLWFNASGTDPFLYLGGLTAGGIAVAVVLGHVVLAPLGRFARVLSWAPLVSLGLISYGVYLWHWPLFALFNAERTGLTGTALLVARLAITVAVAAVSYVVIERPIRTGRWPWRQPTRPVRLRPAGAGVSVFAAVGAAAAFIMVATMLPPVVTVTPIVDIPTAALRGTDSTRTTPMTREGRRPGDQPRIAFFGDSVAWSLGFYMQQFPGLSITTQALPGCGIARLPEIVYIGDPHTNYPECPTWELNWEAGVNADDPDVAVILLDRWELMDRKLGDQYRAVGDPLYDAYLSVELELALSIVGANGAQIVLLTAPYTRRWERPDGSLYPEDKPERVDAWNRLIREVAARHPGTITVIDLNRRVCPDGKFTWNIGRLRIRSDGLHFTPEGVQNWIAPWLVPQLANLAVFGPRFTGRAD